MSAVAYGKPNNCKASRVEGTCDSCGQSVGQEDVDLLPENTTSLRWRLWKDDKESGKKTPEAYECYVCWDSRRRYEKGESQMEVHKTRRGR